MSITELFIAFVLGIAFAAPPGIVTVESIRRGVVGGFWSALAVGAGSLIGDAVYATLALSGLAALVQHPRAQWTIGAVGGVVLCVLARSALRAELPTSPATVSANERRNAFLAGAALSLTNPWAIAFWLGFGGVLLSAGISEPERDIVRFLFAFLAGAALWGVVLSGLIAWGRRYVGARLFRYVSLCSAMIFLGTAFYTWWMIIRRMVL